MIEKGSAQILDAFKPLSFYINDKPTEMLSILYEPSLCIILQGEKEVGIGNNLIRYDANQFLLASMHTPAKVRIANASKEQPYIGFTLNFSIEQIFDVIKEMEPREAVSQSSDNGLYFGKLENHLLEPIVRLFNTLESPEQIKVLAPLYMKEILYYLLQGESGCFIRQYLKEGHSAQKVLEAISLIKNRFSQNLNIKQLAENVGLSESSLYASFKKITTMSPLQFQKTLRLQEARNMIQFQSFSVTETAYKVGYESPSQFSREYSRMYGLSPKADAMKMAQA
ncbi:AraC family transcriptional regulator [Thiomicrorhabdus sediminis]|uniref:AraC family transcriptional regulator n=2 Tax=Thiomicrorhabdus sediminis TaxID=2580412 RepID=A0A4P9K9Q3_9GAMM|nr:AraC family transcriptional regulator [Thiomicrorhabdus sediminis]